MSEAAVAGIRARVVSRSFFATALPRHCFSADLVRGIEAYEALAAESRRLAALNDSATLFQTPELVSAWARHFGSRRAVQLATIVVRDGARPVLIWPLAIERHLLVRIARGAGAPIGQYDDIIIDPQVDRRAALTAAIDVLNERIRPDLIQLERVRADSLLRTALPELAPLNGLETAPYVDLSSGFAAALARRPRYAAKQHRKRVKRLTKAGDCTMAIAGNSAEAEAWMQEALTLKRAWLRDNGLLSRAFVRSETGNCLAELARTLCGPEASPRMVIAKLCLDGRTAAIEVGFLHRKNFHLYLRAFAPDLACFGPGNVLTERMLEWCAANGVERYDMLPPGSRNKSEWQSGAVAVLDFAIPTSPFGVDLVLRRMLPALRNVFYALPDSFRSRLAGLMLRTQSKRQALPKASP